MAIKSGASAWGNDPPPLAAGDTAVCRRHIPSRPSERAMHRYAALAKQRATVRAAAHWCACVRGHGTACSGAVRCVPASPPAGHVSERPGLLIACLVCAAVQYVCGNQRGCGSALRCRQNRLQARGETVSRQLATGGCDGQEPRCCSSQYQQRKWEQQSKAEAAGGRAGASLKSCYMPPERRGTGRRRVVYMRVW